MENEIAWETDLDVALKSAWSKNKVILLYFFNPG